MLMRRILLKFDRSDEILHKQPHQIEKVDLKANSQILEENKAEEKAAKEAAPEAAAPQQPVSKHRIQNKFRKKQNSGRDVICSEYYS